MSSNRTSHDRDPHNLIVGLRSKLKERPSRWSVVPVILVNEREGLALGYRYEL
jgi:hypothetical protein